MVEPLSVAVHAVAVSDIAKGSTAMVVGAGMIGLLVLQSLKKPAARKLSSPILTTPASNSPATSAPPPPSTPRRADTVAEIKKLTNGAGVDCALEAVGSTPTIKAAIESVKRGGTVTLIGNIAPTVEIPLQVVVSRQIRLQGSAASAGEYPQAIDLIARGAVTVKPLITAVAPLEEGAHWFTRLHNREANLMKVVLTSESCNVEPTV